MGCGVGDPPNAKTIKKKKKNLIVSSEKSISRHPENSPQLARRISGGLRTRVRICDEKIIPWKTE